jgi:tRNA dimethylallyltransferase
MRSADILKTAGREAPVLLAGPTASGKSALAMEIAGRLGGVIVNADALQVFADWRILTARPSPADEAALPHRLYGHVPGTTPYSVGQWLRDLRPLLDGPRPIITGGTGLYFAALTEGLAEIPPTPPEIRAEADARLAEHGPAALLAELDPATAARIDRLNPVRIQRAWEVQRATGRGLAAWQDDTGPALLPLERTRAFVLSGPRDWLAARIANRFDAMLAAGVLDEARANMAHWSPRLPSAKAHGAADLIAHLRGEIPLETARERTITITRQYAKRQRTWFRARMSAWMAMLPD